MSTIATMDGMKSSSTTVAPDRRRVWRWRERRRVWGSGAQATGGFFRHPPLNARCKSLGFR
jgi:hypothetical protein